MDFSHFVDEPVIDGHVHLKHPGRLGGILQVMGAVPYTRANLLSMPDREMINQNPAVIRFKAHFPGRAYISAGLDYTRFVSDPAEAAEDLAAQVQEFRAIGFDGLKMYAAEPRSRKWLHVPVDAPEYEPVWARLEALEMPVLSHVAQPEEFWDESRIPAWAKDDERSFSDDNVFPLKEDLYAEMDRVLERHPALKLVLAHFYFLSADLERASRFLDAHPSVCFDLTPGLEMLNNLSLNRDAAREFVIKYQDRLIYGTDITSKDLEEGDEVGLRTSLAKAWVLRAFLEMDGPFMPPDEIDFWLYEGTGSFRGLDLPRDVLRKIYRANFERVYDPEPAALDRERTISALERFASILDVRAGGAAEGNPARRVADELREI